MPTRADILAHYTVLTAVDRNYLEIFAVWLEHFERSGYLPCLRVATFDAESERFVRARGISCAAIDGRIRDPDEIYVLRLNEIASLIESGRNVIHSDADAFWLKPDLPSLVREGCDLQISIGRGIPRSAVREWGFSLCCGFFVLHASPRVERFLADWIEASREQRHDQNALNELLLERRLRWERKEDGQRVGYCRSLDLRVAAIGDDVISRDGVGPDVQIYHPYLSSRNQSNKLLQLRARLDPSRIRRIRARVFVVLNVLAWPEILGGRSRRVLRRATGALPRWRNRWSS